MAKVDIEAKIKRLEEQLKSAKNQKAKIKATQGKKEAKRQNKKDILYAIYRRQLCTTDYEKDISSSDFDKFLIRDYERELFGLPPLDKPAIEEKQSDSIEVKVSETSAPVETKNPVASPEKIPERVYLDVDIKYKDIAKGLGAKWDSAKVKWYAPKGIDPKVIYDAIENFKAKSQEAMSAKDKTSFDIQQDSDDL